jgi:hypothetical protein
MEKLLGGQMSEDDLFYLRSILGHLRELRSVVEGASLGGEALADNIDWLDCFIDKHSRAREGNDWPTSLADAREQIITLRAEVERLTKVLAIEGLPCKVIADIERQQAEVERLTTLAKQLSDDLTKHWANFCEQRAEVERLRAERDDWRATAEDAGRIANLKDAEIERLRTQCGGNCRYWEGRWRDEAAEVARLTVIANDYQGLQHRANEIDDKNVRLEAEKLELAKHVDGCVRVAAEALAEVERLKEDLHYNKGCCDLAMKHRDEAEAEVERLKTLRQQEP